MNTPREMHVISNTHWDREWLFDFQETRMLLAEMLDKLLDILDARPDYKAFLMDGQVIPVEDYLEVRPENRERLVGHVRAGRLQIGPWYTDPECFCVGGESLVRNLLYGHRVANALGGVMKVGYTPFSYGQNSQMPQIYKGFGIDTMLFYHGVSHEEAANEFLFEGADGTRILGSQMSSFARYNYYYQVYRRVKYGEEPDDRMFDWRNGGCPFHLCGEDRAPEHHILLDPKSGFDRERVAPSITGLRDRELGVATTPFLCFMMGHDSSVPDLLELDILEEAAKRADGEVVKHTSLPEHMACVKQAVKDLAVLRGEQRVPKPMPLIYHLYSDVLSSRTRMKRLNARAEMLLQRWAEPFAAAAWALGAPYPRTMLDLAWKTLLSCHAHYSIAGSGIDEIERDMEYRLRQVINVAKGLQRRSLAYLQARIDNSGMSTDDVLVTVFNASPRARSEVVTAIIDVPEHLAIHEFGLTDAVSGAPVAVQGGTRKSHHAIVNHDGDAPAMMRAQRFSVHIEACDLPGLGYRTYRLDPKGAFARGGLAQGDNSMENEHLHAQIAPDGTLSVTHKASGLVFHGLNQFEDGGEAGMAWMHLAPGQDRVINSRGCPVVVSLEENGPLLARYRVDYHMTVPARLEENGGDPWRRLDGVGNHARRSEATFPLLIHSYVSLKKGARSLEVVTRFDNQADSHRLRALFPARRDTNVCHVESAFDVVEREIVFGPDSPWRGSTSVTFPMQRFVDVSDSRGGLAVINDGLREYEVTQTPERAIAVTLLRAYELSLTTVSKRWDIHPEMRLSQCPGEHEFRFLLYPHAGAWDMVDIYGEVERLCVPAEPAQSGAHGGDLPRVFGFMTLEGDQVAVSAVKCSEDGHGVVVRLFNPTTRTRRAMLTFARPLASATKVTLEEESPVTVPGDGTRLSQEIAPKAIVSLCVRLL